MTSNVIIANVVLHDLDLNVQGPTFQEAILTSKSWKNANNTIAIKLEDRYLSSNGATANVVNYDFYLYFHGHKYFNLKCELAKKCSSMTFIEIDVCHWNGECCTP